jgi:hypothetical protein
MALNIKNERTVDIVKRLAVQLGTGYTTAIEVAATAALRLPADSAQELAAQKARRIAAAYRAHAGSESALNTDSLYDKNGLYA